MKDIGFLRVGSTYPGMGKQGHHSARRYDVDLLGNAAGQHSLGQHLF